MRRVGAGLGEAIRLFFVPAFARDLVGADADGDAAELLAVSNLDRTVANNEDFASVQIVVLDDALEHHFLVRLRVGAECAVDLVEVIRDTKEAGFVLHIRLIRTAEDVHRNAAIMQLS